MWRMIFAPFSFLVLAGCDFLDNSFNFTYSAGASYHFYEAGVHRPRKDNVSFPDSSPYPQDVVLYASAVSYPSCYDWRRDSCYGAVDASIILFRNADKIVEVPARGNPSHDRHHIISGRLYTEYFDGSSTIIFRDGESLIRVDGNCTLRGLVEKGDVCHLLLSPLSGSGFYYYQDGERILGADNGSLAISFSDTDAPESGSIYEDQGHVVFCFRRADGSLMHWYKIVDGRETLLSGVSGSAEGVRIEDGAPVVPYKRTFSDYLYYSDGEDSGIMVKWDSDGCVGLSAGSADYSYIDGRWCYVFPSCARYVGGCMYMALTPMTDEALPVLICGDDRIEYEFHGFFSNLSVNLEDR